MLLARMFLVSIIIFQSRIRLDRTLRVLDRGLSSYSLRPFEANPTTKVVAAVYAITYSAVSRSHGDSSVSLRELFL